eukprot:gene4245-14358_t
MDMDSSSAGETQQTGGDNVGLLDKLLEEPQVALLVLGLLDPASLGAILSTSKAGASRAHDAWHDQLLARKRLLQINRPGIPGLELSAMALCRELGTVLLGDGALLFP